MRNKTDKDELFKCKLHGKQPCFESRVAKAGLCTVCIQAGYYNETITKEYEGKG